MNRWTPLRALFERLYFWLEQREHNAYNQKNERGPWQLAACPDCGAGVGAPCRSADRTLESVPHPDRLTATAALALGDSHQPT